MGKLRAGETAPSFDVASLRGERIRVPAGGEGLLQLQFRRYAGCPICNLHLRSVARRLGELEAAKVRVVAVFHSDAAEMAPYQGDLPFAAVADPGRELYRAYGVEASLRSIADPRSWAAGLRGMFAGHPSDALGLGADHLGLPADFLLDPAGRIVAAKYGVHADDQWSVDELLALAR